MAQVIVFVIGTARSGTCWLGRILASHPQITGFVEEEPRFGAITQAAIFPGLREGLACVLADQYRVLEERHGIVSEKAHPAIWIAEELAALLPSARFLAIERDRASVVASMMKHPGVRARCETGWESYPEPCPFLGLEDADDYARLSVEERCGLRWDSHKREIRRLEPVLGDRLLTVEYETLVADQEATCAAIQRWLGLPEPFPRGVK